ncbi:MAG: hypothetical protein ABIF10_05090 [Candidatus Woesearchaeota archaeon]
MSIKQKILVFLIENREKSFSMYGLSKKLAIDYKLIYINIRKLQDEGTINVEDLGSQKRCSFRNSFNKDVYAAEDERRNALFTQKNFRAIHDKLKVINRQFILLLFGSHIKAAATKASDIDLLLVSRLEDSKLIEEKLGILPLKIHLTAILYESFIQSLKTKELTVVSEAQKKCVVLFGIEDYYRLLENAK